MSEIDYSIDSPYWTTPLDCGHLPATPTAFHSTGVAMFTGAARDADGKTLCYDCASKPDIEAVAAGETVYAYVSTDGKQITTWPGAVLMKVTYNGTAPTGFYGSTIHYVRAVAPNGREYYGKNGGNGMAIKMKPRVIR